MCRKLTWLVSITLLLGLVSRAASVSNPAPPDGATDVPTGVVLSWTPGVTTVSYDVYFGTSSPPAFIGNLAASSYDPGTLEPGTTYYWKIDEVEADGTTIHTGDLWSFTTMTQPIADVTNRARELVRVSGAPLSFKEANLITTVTACNRDAIVENIVSTTATVMASDFVCRGIKTLLEGLDEGLLTTSDVEEYRTFVDGIVEVNDYVVAVTWERTRDNLLLNTTAVVDDADSQLIYEPMISSWCNPGPDPGPTNPPTSGSTTWTWRPYPDGATVVEMIFGKDTVWKNPVMILECDDEGNIVWEEQDAQVSTFIDTAVVSQKTKIVQRGECQCKIWTVRVHWATPTATIKIKAGTKGFDFDVEFGGIGSHGTDLQVYELCCDGTSKVREPPGVVAMAVDDFETYTADIGNRIFETWIDGWGYGEPPFGHPGNGTGSMVGISTDVIYGGAQSMRFTYDNGRFVCFSETEQTFDAPQDWSRCGLTALSLWFLGDQNNNPEQMYVAVGDNMGMSNLVNHTNPNAALLDTWQEWNINLQEFSGAGVDLADISSIAIGLGDRHNPQPGGTGTMYFDDIRLVESTEETEDCGPTPEELTPPPAPECYVYIGYVVVVNSQVTESTIPLDYTESPEHINVIRGHTIVEDGVTVCDVVVTHVFAPKPKEEPPPDEPWPLPSPDPNKPPPDIG